MKWIILREDTLINLEQLIAIQKYERTLNGDKHYIIEFQSTNENFSMYFPNKESRDEKYYLYTKILTDLE